MNLARVFKMQKELDDAIISRNDLESFTKEQYQRMWALALLVETGEFANEVQSFKYWKAHKNVDKQKALEEFADVLHFLGSYAYKYDVNPEIEPLILTDDVNLQIIKLYATISSSVDSINKYNLAQMLALLLGAAKLIGYTEEEIMASYEIKNAKNFERVRNKY